MFRFGVKTLEKTGFRRYKDGQGWLEGVMQKACCRQVGRVPHLASLTKKLLLKEKVQNEKREKIK